MYRITELHVPSLSSQNLLAPRGVRFCSCGPAGTLPSRALAPPFRDLSSNEYKHAVCRSCLPVNGSLPEGSSRRGFLVLRSWFVGRPSRRSLLPRGVRRRHPALRPRKTPWTNHCRRHFRDCCLRPRLFAERILVAFL